MEKEGAATATFGARCLFGGKRKDFPFLGQVKPKLMGHKNRISVQTNSQLKVLNGPVRYGWPSNWPITALIGLNCGYKPSQ